MKYRIDEKKVIYADLDPKEGVILNLVTKNYYKLNETSQVVWQGLCSGNSPEEIADSLSRDFEISTEDALSDVMELVSKLKTEQLIDSDNGMPAFSVEGAQKAKRAKKK